MRDPSIQRIVDDEETAANGEMFKDARLQERIFDQIHAVEFNLEDDFRTAEVGSIFPSSSYRDASFQRVDDGDEELDIPQMTMRSPLPIAGPVASFVDSIDEDPLTSGSFQRISDDEETAEIVSADVQDSYDDDEQEEPEKHGFAERVVEKIVSVAKGKRAARKAPASRTTRTKAAGKKAAPRKSDQEEVTSEPAASESSEPAFEDSEARFPALVLGVNLLRVEAGADAGVQPVKVSLVRTTPLMNKLKQPISRKPTRSKRH